MRNRLLALTAALLLLGASVAVAKDSFPEVISLPNGFQPEGIAIGDGKTFYVGSIPTGAIYRGDIRTGQGSVFIQGATGHAATGLKATDGRLYVSGAAAALALGQDRGAVGEVDLAACAAVAARAALGGA